MTNSTKWFVVAIINFLIAALYGTLLRLAFVTEINWIDFRNVLHGHSHMAMLGWLYLAIFILLTHFFIRLEDQRKHYKAIFMLTQVTVIGMAISFPIQGYAAFSIAFSTAHVLLSYAFVYKFFRDTKSQKRNPSLRFAQMALIFMVLSTLALFAMAPIIVMDLKTSNLYYMAVQFFLHFQFNGWFIFAVLALFFKLMENWNINFTSKPIKLFFWTLVISCCLTYALAVTWSNPSPLLFLINSIGVIIQLVALVIFIWMVKEHRSLIKSKMSRTVSTLFTISFLAFCIKIIVQSAVVIPYIGKIGYTIRNYVIGFIHLILLGAITFAILALAYRIGYLSTKSSLSIKGITILTLGIFLSELLLFLQGTLLWGAQGFIPYYYELLFAVSALMPLGVAVLLVSVIKGKEIISISS